MSNAETEKCLVKELRSMNHASIPSPLTDRVKFDDAAQLKVPEAQVSSFPSTEDVTLLAGHKLATSVAGTILKGRMREMNTGA